MASMILYEKPGCINGEKQKRILERAGNRVQCKNILTEKWDRLRLLPFVEGKKAVEMINFTAPAVKKGEVRPEELSFEQAVEQLIAFPILIKRPLILVDGCYIQGFTDERLTPYLGDWDRSEDVITCPNLQKLSCDESKPSPG